MIRKTVIVILSFVMSLGFCMLLTSASHADNADVLPKGVWRLRVDSKLYLPVDRQFNDDGEEEDVAEDFNANLDSTVFPALQAVEAAFGLPAGSATIGRSKVDIEYNFYLFDFFVERGLTDRLAVGIKIPYWHTKTHVDAELDSSSATVGKTAIGTGLGAPIAPLAGPFPDTVPLTTEDVQQLLGPGLDTNNDGTVDIPGFGYKRVETQTNSGLSDIEAGLKYQYLKTEDLRLALLGAVRFPTGEEDDPDDLMDYPLGEGAYGLLFHLNNSYVGASNLVIDLTFKYEVILEHKQEVRVQESVDQPIVPEENKETVDINPGDIIRIEPSLAYEFLKGASLIAEYEFGYRSKANVSGDRGLNYSSLEEESDFKEHVIKVGLSYSTIPLYAEKKFPLPLSAYVLYRNRFAGQNVLKSQYIGIGLAVYF
ncbi:MAG: hypothetical protein ACYSSN_11585 [Planctomycetota bacterium]